MKIITASLLALSMAVTLTACNNSKEVTNTTIQQKATPVVAPPRKETGVSAAEEMLAKSTGNMLGTYAKMYAGTKGEAPGSFHDFVVEGQGDGTSTTGLGELSLEKCAVSDAEIACPQDTYSTVLVTYRLGNEGDVTTDIKSKY